jgi:hypothetical protein
MKVYLIINNKIRLNVSELNNKELLHVTNQFSSYDIKVTRR